MDATLGYMIPAYFTVITLVSFALMGIDKQKAKRGAYRIPEASLFITALLGGSIGSVAGMLVFHHKTQHWYFQVFMPLIAFLQMMGLILCMTLQMGWLS